MNFKDNKKTNATALAASAAAVVVIWPAVSSEYKALGGFTS